MRCDLKENMEFVVSIRGSVLFYFHVQFKSQSKWAIDKELFWSLGVDYFEFILIVYIW